MYKFASTCKILKRNKQVVIANTKNGMWIRISEEVFLILKALCGKETVESLEYADEEDEKWVKNIIEECCKMQILFPKMVNENIPNSMASVEMTLRCNLHCIHCCVDAQCDMTEKNDLSTIRMKEILDKLIIWNPKTIMLSGGEPLLRKDFCELLQYLRNNYKGKIIVSTNGILINHDNVKVLIEAADQIDISLDGYDEQTCSLIRGKGVFKKVMSAVQQLQENGFENISLSMVVSENNEHWEGEFRKLNEKLNTRANCRIFSPTGRGENSKSFFSNLSNDKVYIPSEFKKKGKKDKVSFSCCSAGSREIFIDYQGDVYPCPSYVEKDFKLGNILNVEKIDDITKDYNHLDMVISRLKNKGIDAQKCRNCDVNIFCWDCPGAVEFYNTQEALEYQCKTVFPLLSQRVWDDK